MHNAPLPLRGAAIAAVLFLSACGSKPQQTAAAPPANDAAMAENAPANAAVVLPPSLAASRTYRCKDNSLVYVDFYSDNVTADLRTKKDGEVTKLTAPEAGKALTGGGFTVSANSGTANITQPSAGSQSCTS